LLYQKSPKCIFQIALSKCRHSVSSDTENKCINKPKLSVSAIRSSANYDSLHKIRVARLEKRTYGARRSFEFYPLFEQQLCTETKPIQRNSCVNKPEGTQPVQHFNAPKRNTSILLCQSFKK
jgi:hypothetical protein